MEYNIEVILKKLNVSVGTGFNLLRIKGYVPSCYISWLTIISASLRRILWLRRYR